MARIQPREIFYTLIPKKCPVVPANTEQKKQCRRCGAEFQTRSRSKPRCDACQTLVTARRIKRNNERLKERRRLRKQGSSE